jgi:hypothetical protein
MLSFFPKSRIVVYRMPNPGNRVDMQVQCLDQETEWQMRLQVHNPGMPVLHQVPGQLPGRRPQE